MDDDAPTEDAAKMNPRQRKAIRLYKPLFPIIVELVKRGYTFDEVAEELTAKGHRTVDGGPLHKVTIYRILARFNHAEKKTPKPTWRKGLTRSERTEVSAELDAIILHLSRKGWDKGHIAAKVGLSIHSVRRRIKRLVDEGRLHDVDERKTKAAKSS